MDSSRRTWPEDSTWYSLERLGDGAWETVIPGNLEGGGIGIALTVLRTNTVTSIRQHNILDPYALATLSREGPGIVLDPDQINRQPESFKTPQWQDLVVVEAHVRDLVAKAPILVREGRAGFAGLTRVGRAPAVST